MSAHNQKGVAPLIIILIIAALLGTGIVGASYYVKIKNEKEQANLQVKTSDDKINNIENRAEGKIKYELEGTLSSVSPTDRTIRIKISTSSNSIASLRGAEQEISVALDAEIVISDLKSPSLADLTIGSKVNVKGSIKDSGKLVASRVVLQKSENNEDVAEQKSEFELHGVISKVDNTSLSVLVQATNQAIADQKGKIITIATASATIIKSDGKKVDLSGLSIGQKVEIQGNIVSGQFIATQIEAEKIEIAN